MLEHYQKRTKLNIMCYLVPKKRKSQYVIKFYYIIVLLDLLQTESLCKRPGSSSQDDIESMVQDQRDGVLHLK